MQVLKNLANKIRVTLVWVPGNISIQENETNWQRIETETSRVRVLLSRIKPPFGVSSNKKMPTNGERMQVADEPERSCKRTTQLKTMDRGRLSTIISLNSQNMTDSKYTAKPYAWSAITRAGLVTKLKRIVLTYCAIVQPYRHLNKANGKQKDTETEVQCGLHNSGATINH